MRQKFPLREKDSHSDSHSEDSHSDSHSEHAVNHWCCIKGREIRLVDGLGLTVEGVGGEETLLPPKREQHLPAPPGEGGEGAGIEG